MTVISVWSSGIGVHHKLRNFSGYLLCATSTGWNLKVFWLIWYLVRWSTGCSVTVADLNCFGSDWERRSCSIGWWLAGMSSVGMGCALGGAFTIRVGGVPGVAVGTLGARCLCVDRLQRNRSVVDIGAFVSSDQCSMISWRALTALSCAYTVDARVFFSAAVSFCTPCSTTSYVVTDGWLSLWCLNSMVSDAISVLVPLDTTFWQR